jgi:hypothetical protein
MPQSFVALFYYMNILFSAPDLPINTSGIYRMTIDGKWIYIGSSCNLRRRFLVWKHRCNVRKTKNKKICTLFQIARFVSIDVLEFVGNDTRLERELFYIKYLSKTEYLLNIVGLRSPYIKTGITNKKKIASFKNGKLVSVYSSIHEAANDLNIRRDDIGRFFRGQRLSIRGMTFKLVGDNGDFIDFKVRNKKKRVVKSVKRRMGIGGKTVMQFDLDGNYINKYESIGIAAKETGKNKSMIFQVINGDRRQTGGYIYRYE